MGSGAASGVRAEDKENDAAHVLPLPGCLPSHHNNDQANSGDALSRWITATHSQARKHDRPRAITETGPTRQKTKTEHSRPEKKREHTRTPESTISPSYRVSQNPSNPNKSAELIGEIPETPRNRQNESAKYIGEVGRQFGGRLLFPTLCILRATCAPHIRRSTSSSSRSFGLS